MLGLLLTLIVFSAFGSELTSHAHLEAMLEKAQQFGTSPGWLRLGHYRRLGLTGKFKGEADGANFYLQSATDPTLELAATLRAFAAPVTNESEHAQCRYLARRSYIQEKLGWDKSQWRWLDCAQQQAWIERLDADAVSLIFATSYMNNPASMFGHTFLKFHTQTNPADKDLLNYGVNFAAQTGQDGGAEFIWRGLSGGYRGGFTLLPYHVQLKEYTNIDGRDIWEYKLNLSKSEVRKLIEHLLELERTHFDYYFLDENCSYQLLAALEAVRPEQPLTDDIGYFVIPADTIHRLKEKWVVSRHHRPSLQSLFKWTSHDLNSSEREWLRQLTTRPVREVMQKPAWQALQANRQAMIVDSALVYASYKPDTHRAPEHGYQLKVARAQLDAPPRATSAQPSVGPPELGHDSSQVSFHIGQFENRSFIELQSRAAYHHILSQSAGHLMNSQLEIARIRLRLDHEQRLYLQEFTALDILSAPPLTPFIRPLSWKLSFRAERFMDREQSTLDPLAEGGVGITFSLTSRTYLMSFAQMHAQYGADLNYETRVGVSPEFALLSHLSDSWRLWSSYQYRWYLIGEKVNFPVWEIAQSFNPTRNFEVRTSYASRHSFREWKGQVLWHF